MVEAFPRTFRIRNLKTDGATIHVRAGGQGPAVVMLHGFGDTGDMWAPVAAVLAKDHGVVVPDLRGMGLSRLVPKAATTRRPKPTILRPSWTS